MSKFRVGDNVLEPVESKKIFTIQEVLVEENMGKKFEFESVVYEVDDDLDLVRKDSKQIEDVVSLLDILNGEFVLIEE